MIHLIRLLLAGAFFAFTSGFITNNKQYQTSNEFRKLFIHRLKDKEIDLSVVVNNEPIFDNIQQIELSDELKSSFMSYAMSTILGRCLPDSRDGMKPVHRRVLYAMHALNLTPDSGYRKCARVVGEVLGKFHPHGDQSVYDALVRMAQDFVMLHPLIRGHGNFGSMDDDPPAAMRYTECKLSSLAYDSLLQDIKENTVDFVPNFDGNEEEPLVLPARLPMLLLNGASGIAVGMATNIPPHNLGEIADAVIALIKNPLLSHQELSVIVPAPDFPTGGKIMGSAGSKLFHETGKGTINLRATCHTELITTSTKAGTRTRNALVITEMPYMANKAGLLEKIADMVNDKKIEGIADLRDESDRDGMRVVVELKRDAVAAVVQNNLFKKTSLQTTFPANMLALVDEGKQPQRISLKRSLEIFIAFRFETIRRRSKHRLEKLESRDHVVVGLLIALKRIDEIIELLRKSKDSNQAKEVLISPTMFNLTVIQAEAILGLRLGRLTSLEVQKLEEEHQDLTQSIHDLQIVMMNDTRVYDIMIQETTEIKNKHAVPRRSVIWEEEGQLSVEDLLANDRSVIMVTASGYVKRLPILEFEAQSRGGKGKAGTKLATDDDKVVHFFSCNDHDMVLFITDKGIAYSVKAHQIPLASRIAKGVPLPQVLPIAGDETVTTVIPVENSIDPITGLHNNEDVYLVLLTSYGYMKKTPLKAFRSISQRGLIIITLEEGDSLRWARLCKRDEEVLIATKDGFATRFSSSDLTSTSRTARGVRALSLREGDRMTDMDILKLSSPSSSKANTTAAVSSSGTTTPEEELYGASHILAVTDKGYGKRVPIDEFRTQRRGGKGVTIIKFKTKAGGGGIASRKAIAIEAAEVSAGGGGSDMSSSDMNSLSDCDALSCMRLCSAGDEVVLSTRKGTIIRQRVDDLSIQSRTATGVLIQKIAKDDVIVMVDIVPMSHQIPSLASSTESSTSTASTASVLPAPFIVASSAVITPPASASSSNSNVSNKKPVKLVAKK